MKNLTLIAVAGLLSFSAVAVADTITPRTEPMKPLVEGESTEFGPYTRRNKPAPLVEPEVKEFGPFTRR